VCIDSSSGIFRITDGIIKGTGDPNPNIASYPDNPGIGAALLWQKDSNTQYGKDTLTSFASSLIDGQSYYINDTIEVVGGVKY